MGFTKILVFAKEICQTKILVKNIAERSLQILDLYKKFLETKILQMKLSFRNDVKKQPLRCSSKKINRGSCYRSSPLIVIHLY